MAPYNAAEMSITALEGDRPYGSGVTEEEATRSRQQTEQTTARPNPRQNRDLEIGAGVASGGMTWPDEPEDQDPGMFVPESFEQQKAVPGAGSSPLVQDLYRDRGDYYRMGPNGLEQATPEEANQMRLDSLRDAADQMPSVWGPLASRVPGAGPKTRSLMLDEEEEQPRSPGGIGGAMRTIPQQQEGVGLKDLFGYIVSRLEHGLGQIGEGAQEIGDAAGQKSETAPEGMRAYGSGGSARGKAVGGALKVAGGAAEATVAMPFMAIADLARETIVNADPDMVRARDEFMAMTGLDPNDPVMRSEANGKVIGITRDLMLEGAQNVDLSWDQRGAAAILGLGFAASQFAELGGPSGVRWMARNGPRLFGTLRNPGGLPQMADGPVAQAQQGSRIAGQINVPMDAEQLAAEAGQVTSAQRATNDVLKAEIARREAGANVGAGIISAQAKGLRDAQRFIVQLTGSNKLLWRQADLDRIDETITAIESVGPSGGLLNDLKVLRADVYDTVMGNAANKLIAREGVKMATEGQRVAAKAANQADLGVRRAARSASNASNRLEETAARFGAAQEQAQAAALKGRVKDIQKVGREQGRAGEEMAGAIQQGSRTAEKISRTTSDEVARIAEEGEAIKARTAGVAQKMAREAQALADRMHAAAQRTRTTVRTFAEGDTPRAEVGYVRPDDAELLDKFHIRTGKYESPQFAETMADTLRANPDEALAIQNEMRTLTNQELEQRVANILRDHGVDEEVLAASLPGRGELASKYLLAAKTEQRLATNVQSSAEKFRQGMISQEKYDEDVGKLLSFSQEFLPFRSEGGRLLQSMKLQIKNLPLNVIVANRKVRTTQRVLDRRAAVVDEKSRIAAEALEYADSQAPKIDALTAKAQATASTVEELLQSQARLATEVERGAASGKFAAAQKELTRLLTDRTSIENATSKRVQDAQTALAKAIDDADTARAEYEASVQMAADSAAEFHRAALITAERKAVEPEQFRVLANMDPLNVAGILGFLRDKTTSQPFGEKVTAYMMNNMYGAAQSLMQNGITNTINSAVRNVPGRVLGENVVAPVVNRVLGETVMARGEAQAALSGITTAAPDAARYFLKRVIHGEDMERDIQYGLAGRVGAGGAFDIPARSMVKGPKGLAVEGALRVLSGGDGFQRIMDGAAETRALAYLRGFKEGGAQSGARRVAESIAGTNPDELRRAAQVAGETTFSNRAVPGSNTQKLLGALDVSFKGFSPLRVLIPAAKFAINYALAGTKMTPVGIGAGIRKVAQAKGMERGAERTDVARSGIRDITAGLIGTALVVPAAALQANGLITGSRPTDPTEAKAWDDEGRVEYAAKFGDLWVPLAWFGPAGVPFIMTAVASEIDDDVALGDKLGRAAVGVGRYYTDMPILSATYDLLDTITTFFRYGFTAGSERFASNQFVRRLIPDEATLRSLNSGFDRVIRDPQGSDRGGDLEGIIERVVSGLPYFSGKVRPKIDPSTGEPATRAEGFLPWLLRAGQPSENATERVFREAGALLQEPPDMIGTVRLEPDAYTALSEDTGRRVQGETDRAIASSVYKDTEDQLVREAIVMSARDDARKAARRTAADGAVKAAKDQESTIRAAMMAHATMSLAEYAYAIEDFTARGLITPEVKQMLDASNQTRPRSADGSVGPSVEEIQKATPLIHQYRRIPLYPIGNSGEWNRVEQLKSERSLRLKGVPTIQRDRATAAYLRGLSQTDRSLLLRYDSVGYDPRRQRFIDQNPQVRPYVTRTTE